MAEEDTPDPFTNMWEAQAKLARAMLAPLAVQPEQGGLMTTALRMQRMWLDFQAEQGAAQSWGDPAQWLQWQQTALLQWPMLDPERQKALWEDGLVLWQQVLGGSAGDLPRADKRFAAEEWRENPAFVLIHQTYLLLTEQLAAMVEAQENVPPKLKEQMRFFTRAVNDAASPANVPWLNPVVLQRTAETGGANLVKGMEHLLNDLRRGQLTHTDPDAFRLGENIAVTPGKVIHQTELYQLIQYSPTTDEVLEVPLVIFPPWINRFYILDLNPKKSFVRWAVQQGLTVFMVSWKSADASLKDIEWDDYIRAQTEAIDHVRQRLGVEAVHTIGYCVAGTTLAATLAVMATREEAEKVQSATFFTAQVDFSEAGELLNFVDDQQLAALEALTPDGYLDGRYMAATFNLLRGTDLIWNYVLNNYLLGEEYPAFDLLHWNGDVTNLPAKWHQSYLRDLYRDNRLVKRGSLVVDGVAIDLSKVTTPVYIQAGKEDHIAPAASVWKMTEQFKGPVRFVLAGSGHIAGVVNPPDARKYQYWTYDEPAPSLAAFQEQATEHPGSWWPDWIKWLRTHAPQMVEATGKRRPGSDGDDVIEDAPGIYVQTR
ncbi:alpha/beta hydrolase [Porphyrobacter sp. GA68]|uniref:PHA/PHB synthase family protein n=1 Tax=Porphyrobacter sp. GA68 TaxID=2883480 RepID=UPI001D188F7C|nr:class I poly(R)-hydroxyalkanoic acid synthase [Porphyrobacter sp. GA68]